MSLRQRKANESSKSNADDTPHLVLESNGSWEKTFDDDELNEEGHSTSTNAKSKQPVVPNSDGIAPSTLDAFLQNYGKFSASTFTADQGLKVLQWSSWAVSYMTRTNDPNNHLSASLRKLYNEMSMTRYALRFYGFFPAFEGYLNGSWDGGNWDNPMIAKLAKYVMAGSMLFYYPLEHIAYAGWQMPKLSLVRGVDANRVSAVSCVFWTMYIVGDFWASCLKWQELKKKLSDLGELLSGKKATNDKEAVEEVLQQQQSLLNKIRHVKLQVLRSLLFILPAINWSLPNWATNPLLSEPVVNGLMLTEAYTSVYQSLRGMIG
jgi:hypothetical protein